MKTSPSIILTTTLHQGLHLVCASLGYIFLAICVLLSYATEASHCLATLIDNVVSSTAATEEKSRIKQKQMDMATLNDETIPGVIMNETLKDLVAAKEEEDSEEEEPQEVLSSATVEPKAIPEEQPIVTRDLRDLINAEGDLQCEMHSIRTNHGHSVETVRVYHKTWDSKASQPVILQHGLLLRNGVFATSGSKSLAFVIARSGNFDVWLPDTRCGGGVMPQEMSGDIWNWGLQELAEDFEKIVQYVRQMSEGKKPIYCGHSQGAAQALLKMLKTPQVSRELAGFVGLAPAFFLKRPEAGPMSLLCGTSEQTREWLFGTGAFLPLMSVAQNILPGAVFGSMAGHMFEYLFDWKRVLWPAGQDVAFFQWTPSVVSSKLVSEWVASLARGCVSESARAPDCHCPVMVISGAEDSLVDGSKLAAEMTRMKGKIHAGRSQSKENARVSGGCPGCCNLVSMNIEGYSHLDVIWAKDAPEKVFVPLVGFLKSCSQKERQEQEK